MSNALASVLLLVVCAATLASASPSSCYSGSSSAPVTLSSMGAAIPAGDYVCVRYCFTCTAGDGACSASQVSSNAILPSYSYVDSSTASSMAGFASMYPNFYQCSTTDCNTPVTNLCNTPTPTPTPTPSPVPSVCSCSCCKGSGCTPTTTTFPADRPDPLTRLRQLSPAFVARRACVVE